MGRECGWHTPKWHVIGGREGFTLLFKANSNLKMMFPRFREERRELKGCVRYVRDT
jgi:hypothetical protein